MLHVRSQRPAFPSKIDGNLQLDRSSPVNETTCVTLFCIALDIHQAAGVRVAALIMTACGGRDELG